MTLRDEGHMSSSAAFSRRSLKRQAQKSVIGQNVYGTLLQTVRLPLVAGGWWERVVPNPVVTLNLCASTPAFAQLLQYRMAQRPSLPSKPWHLIYYADECATGNLLRQDPSSKAWCIYYSFVELGPDMLSRDDSWFLGGIIRAKHVDRIDGGFGGRI